MSGIDLNDPEVNAAASTIQAAFRGHKARKDKMKAQENDAEELDVDLSDPDLVHAATKIQASFRGHMVRKQKETKKEDEDLSTELEKLETKDELADMDLSDPDLHKAATKIQASFRGHMTRKQVEGP